jgi:hypothetical protein
MCCCTLHVLLHAACVARSLLVLLLGQRDSCVHITAMHPPVSSVMLVKLLLLSTAVQKHACVAAATRCWYLCNLTSAAPGSMGSCEHIYSFGPTHLCPP